MAIRLGMEAALKYKTGGQAGAENGQLTIMAGGDQAAYDRVLPVIEVYAKAVKGRFRTIKWTALMVLLGIYYVTPWLRWGRGPDAPNQAVLADLDVAVRPSVSHP